MFTTSSDHVHQCTFTTVFEGQSKIVLIIICNYSKAYYELGATIARPAGPMPPAFPYNIDRPTG